MIQTRKAKDRGQASFGWLNSRHTFSFGQYYDPDQMGFSALRVINDDTVSPAGGFATHGHQNMEIISYVLEGEIAHKDSTGNIETVPAGEFQLMSAGKGIYHSEYNASDTQILRFLQIWIEPDEFDGEPGYQQKAFGQHPGLTTIVSPGGDNDSLKIKQDAQLHQLILPIGSELTYRIQTGRKLYLHLVKGDLELDGQVLAEGDGAKITDQNTVTFLNTGQIQVTALVFDLP